MSGILSFISSFELTARNCLYLWRTRRNHAFLNHRRMYEILRRIHQIEKGMCINSPKQGFGIKKIDELIVYLNEIKPIVSEDPELLQTYNMGVDLISSYIDCYRNNKWDLGLISEIIKNSENLMPISSSSSKSAGAIIIQKELHSDADYLKLYDIAKSRHSIRDFTGNTLSNKDIKDAIEIAQMAPSACNRQAVKYYIIDKSWFEKIHHWISDIGYFGEYGFDKIILITGVITGYNENENIQHLISPGIAIGYLMLALEAKNIGACVMQRHIMVNNDWISVCKTLNIPLDEQCICIIGCGDKREKYKVPISKRFSIDAVVKTFE